MKRKLANFFYYRKQLSLTRTGVDTNEKDDDDNNDDEILKTMILIVFDFAMVSYRLQGLSVLPSHPSPVQWLQVSIDLLQISENNTSLPERV